jgi:hypothetical protein
MNPHDLDAMDESVPFTKILLDRLLGIESSEADYKHYFLQFCDAQQRREVKTNFDKIKKSMNWANHYQDFLHYELPNSIGIVQSFKANLKNNVIIPNVSYSSPNINLNGNSHINRYNYPRKKSKKCIIL